LWSSTRIFNALTSFPSSRIIAQFSALEHKQLKERP
jgi:hypothetical protein